MIYVVVVAVLLTFVGFYSKLRTVGITAAVRDTVAVAVLGWISGLWIGIAARIGMWSIPFFNGTGPIFTLPGTIQVVLVFSLYGIGLGIIYDLVFRRTFRNHGALFGGLVTLVSVYPLSVAAVQQLSFTPRPIPLIIVAFSLVGLMFVPFAVVLEFLLDLYHRGVEHRPSIARSIHS